jgi:hypothetical protein
MTKVWIKVQAVVRNDREELVVACCDSDILDKHIVDGKIDFHVSKQFFGGELVDADKMIKVLARATTANIVGVECVNAALSAGLINESNIKKVKGVPHAQIFSL